jgi:hypothetical protein
MAGNETDEVRLGDRSSLGFEGLARLELVKIKTLVHHADSSLFDSS